jgi:hypothetical protein
MATKSEIKEWLEACGAGDRVCVVWQEDKTLRIGINKLVSLAIWLDGADVLHLLNPSLTGIQGPTFAEWQRQKGREGKVRKIESIMRDRGFFDYEFIAERILDAIEGEQ